MLIKWIIQQEAVKVQSTILRNRVSIDPPLNAWVVVGLFRFTIIWESMIVIIRENRAEVIEIMWGRVEPRAA